MADDLLDKAPTKECKSVAERMRYYADVMRRVGISELELNTGGGIARMVLSK